MVAQKKIRKMRGSKTHGYGSKKKHRGAGSRGGRGLAGSAKHKRFFIMRHMPGHFGKHGFKRPAKVVREERVINLGSLETLFNKGKKSRKPARLDLGALGFDKLLGKGEITIPVIVKVKRISKLAKEKILKAGGKVELS